MSNSETPDSQLSPESATEAGESFVDLLSQYEKSHSRKTEDGGKQLIGTVIVVTGDSVFLDIGFKSEGILPLAAQGAGGIPKPGDKLPVSVKLQSGASATETQNISANGVLFEVESDMPVGSVVDFTISLPAGVVGAAHDVRVDCRGRVVRSSQHDGRRGIGVVIDEYRFERR